MMRGLFTLDLLWKYLEMLLVKYDLVDDVSFNEPVDNKKSGKSGIRIQMNFIDSEGRGVNTSDVEDISNQQQYHCLHCLFYVI